MISNQRFGQWSTLEHVAFEVSKGIYGTCSSKLLKLSLRFVILRWPMNALKFFLMLVIWRSLMHRSSRNSLSKVCLCLFRSEFWTAAVPSIVLGFDCELYSLEPGWFQLRGEGSSDGTQSSLEWSFGVRWPKDPGGSLPFPPTLPLCFIK